MSRVGTSKAEEVGATANSPEQPTKVVWDDSRMETTFANVVNVLSTREEFTMLFGTNRTWNVVGSKELTVGLSHRMVLTPYAAKRLATLLQARLQDYENRFGELKI